MGRLKGLWMDRALVAILRTNERTRKNRMSEKKEEGLSVEMVFAQVGVEFTEIASPMGPLGALQVTLTAPAGQPPATLVLGVPAARQLVAALREALSLHTARPPSRPEGLQ
jgi:hypothetical protein